VNTAIFFNTSCEPPITIAKQSRAATHLTDHHPVCLCAQVRWPPCAAPKGIVNLIKCTVIANGVGYKTLKRDIPLVTNVPIRQPILKIPFHNSPFEILRELSGHRHCEKSLIKRYRNCLATVMGSHDVLKKIAVCSQHYAKGSTAKKISIKLQDPYLKVAGIRLFLTEP